MVTRSGRGGTGDAAGGARRLPRSMRSRLAAIVLCALILAPPGIVHADFDERVILPYCAPFLLPVTRIVSAPAQYVDFCTRFPAECDMRGPSVIELSDETWLKLNKINKAVNAEICFVPDPEEFGFEDYWTLPLDGYGDCEDFALEKRRRLVEGGLPRAAMRMAIGQHQLRLFSHAVLKVNTTRGCFVLDDMDDRLICWNDALLNYEMRENLDGTWSRFDQFEWPLFPIPRIQAD